jgi:hypothetical protein
MNFPCCLLVKCWSTSLQSVSWQLVDDKCLSLSQRKPGSASCWTWPGSSSRCCATAAAKGLCITPGLALVATAARVVDGFGAHCMRHMHSCAECVLSACVHSYDTVCGCVWGAGATVCAAGFWRPLREGIGVARALLGFRTALNLYAVLVLLHFITWTLPVLVWPGGKCNHAMGVDLSPPASSVRHAASCRHWLRDDWC